MSRAPGPRRAAATFAGSAALALSLAACRSGAPAAPRDAASPAASDSCTANGSRLVGWRVIRGDDFTICAPSDWSYANDKLTRGRSYVAWGTAAAGEPPTDQSELVGVPEGEVPGGGTLRSGVPNDSYHATERIGGSVANLYAIDALGVYWTSATWTRPALTLAGQAHDPGSAHEELDMYRSVRFDRAAPADSTPSAADTTRARPPRRAD